MTTFAKNHRPRDARSGESKLLFWLQQAHQAMRVNLLQGFKAAGHEITTEQFSILAMLWQHAEATQTAIAQATGRERASVSRLLGSLEAKGLVRREALDRRTNRVTLTDAGKALHHSLEPIVADMGRHLLADCPRGDLDTATGVLRDIAKSRR